MCFEASNNIQKSMLGEQFAYEFKEFKIVLPRFHKSNFFHQLFIIVESAGI